MKSLKGEKKRDQFSTLYIYTKCCMCVWNWACVFFCLCCMHSSNPLLKLDSAQYRHRCHVSQVTLLPLSPLPPFLFFHPLCSLFSSLHIIWPPSPVSTYPYPLPCSLCLLSSSLLLLLQPLMTYLKPTVGNTVREGTEALLSHRPNQRAAAQGKVHTRLTCAHPYNTHKVSWLFSCGKNRCTHNYR